MRHQAQQLLPVYEDVRLIKPMQLAELRIPIEPLDLDPNQIVLTKTSSQEITDQGDPLSPFPDLLPTRSWGTEWESEEIDKEQIEVDEAASLLPLWIPPGSNIEAPLQKIIQNYSDSNSICVIHSRDLTLCLENYKSKNYTLYQIEVGNQKYKIKCYLNEDKN